ncbi:MAG: hypothetical protein SGBAC_003932 [Bacillariaceae sp.]
MRSCRLREGLLASDAIAPKNWEAEKNVLNNWKDRSWKVVSTLPATLLSAAPPSRRRKVSCPYSAETTKQPLKGPSRGDVFLKQTPGEFYFQIAKFHRALSLHAGARKIGKRQYRTAAKEVRRAIRKSEKAGDPNVVQYEDVQYRLQEAIRLYDVWGVAGKVEAQLDTLE